MIGAILYSLFLFQAAAPVFSAAQGESGVRLRLGDAWSPMQPAPFSNVKARGVEKFIYTGGYTNLDMDTSFDGPRAALRISDRKPVFMVSQPVSENNAPVLVRLERKKDRRVCRTRLSFVSIGNKQGFRRQDIVSAVLTENPDKTFTVQPERPLKPGEYLFVIDSPVSGYDFGVD